MTDIRTLLTSALDDEPPLTIDRDRAIRTGKRTVHRRRLLAVAAATLVLAGTPVALNAVDPRVPAGLQLPTELLAAPSTSDQHAAELTEVLDKNLRPITVVNKGDHYAAEHTIVLERNPPIRMTLLIEVRWDVYRPCEGCQVRDLTDRRLVRHPSSGNGTRHEVSAFLPDGTNIRVISVSDSADIPAEGFTTLEKYASMDGLTF
ncbi:hypothetical protein FKR81_08425 [Lentzea tibetensis]|uniref:Uncharacterized protein n=1 Tax=Lentzea tibetensis TaxID=2591470 RepID=A0A563EZF3_9PSEU|nr:hypothetical protein [Lentzea tibetensis]TWP53095.1 hypothetical protein FKR81_08425 [Lentzea tibetensis]